MVPLTFIFQDDVSEDSWLPISYLQELVEVLIPALVQGLGVDTVHCLGDLLLNDDDER